MFDFQNLSPIALDEQVSEEQPNKEGEDRDIQYSPPTGPSGAPIGKECKAGQTVSDCDEEEEEDDFTIKPPVIIPPLQQPETSYKQRYFYSNLNSPLPRVTSRMKRL